MIVRIIVVHGRGAKPSRACKLEYVRTVLIESVRRVDRPAAAWLAGHPQAIQLAYYADLLRRSSGDPVEECNSFRAPLQRLFRESRMCPTWAAFQGHLRDLGADGAVLLSRFLDPAVRVGLLEEQFQDILPYFQRPAVAERIRRRLRDVLLPALRRRERVVLIAHSFGSVVAYDVLWQLSHRARDAAWRDRRLAGFVTLGSPLGDRLVREHLLGARHPLPQRYPRNITAWWNVSARGDAICHDARVRDDFAPMLAQGAAQMIRDRVNLCTVYRGREGRWNPHKLYGYLILPEVGRLVAEQLRAAGVGRQMAGKRKLLDHLTKFIR